MFQGFPEETVRFFLDLRFHNEVTWFHAHREEYETFIRKPFFDLIDELAPSVSSIDPSFEIRPSKCISRINRDIRFSKDKSPYRDHLWFLFRRGGEPRDESVMYWFELGPDSLNWGLGFWGENRSATDVLRKIMTERPQQIRKVFRSCMLPSPEFHMDGHTLRSIKPPPTLPLDLIPLYSMSSVYIERVDIPFELCYRPELSEAVQKDFLRLAPLYHLLRTAADQGRKTMN